ncbi:UPF0767 family,NADH-ubiquinone oxidoreductase flavoprotein 3 [Cinara cedri]|uniref:UPF0767 family,NADH-ubiquinone oxidoreductase flavoprotein 3 n=1 Tax=Cinara cedri TaxID=506608 RepID=A0A5E4NLQ2_9HEMI|nr:UPF0767 family,NADH-ubiquinone oxidoreductase flavoprotein 3 [Cinara cedri]
MRINNVLTKSCLIKNQFRRFVATTEKPKDVKADVKGLSSKVIIANPSPERVKKAAENGPYKNPQYFSYHKTSYFDAEIEMLQYRLPVPSSLKFSMSFYRILIRYVPMITFPVAFVAGVIGYNLERTVRDVTTPSKPSILEEKRKKKNDPKIYYEEIPVLDRNPSPQFKR